MAFKIRRGTNAERLTITPAQGELIYTTDTKKLYVGDGSTVGGIASDMEVPLNYSGNDLFFTNTGFVNIGNSSTRDGKILLYSNTYTSSLFGGPLSYVQHHNTADSNNFTFFRARGTASAPLSVLNNDDISEFGFAASDGANTWITSVISVSVNGTPIAGAIPTRFRFTLHDGVTVGNGGLRGVLDINHQGQLKVDKITAYNDNAHLQISRNGTGRLKLNGLNFPNDDGSSGNLLTTNGAGELSWVGGIATTSYVDTAISNIVDSAPTLLNTLNELAAAVADDANFASTVTTALGKRVRYDDVQTLTASQKLVAQTNIGLDAAALQSDWTQSDNTARDFIKNKPTIPAAQVKSDWNSTTGLSEILNKPTIPNLAAVAQNILPTTDVTYDLGSPAKRFRDLYLSGSTIDLGGKTLSISGGTLSVGGNKFGESGNVVGVAITQWNNTYVYIRLDVGSAAETIANSIVKGDILKLDPAVGQTTQLTVVSNDLGTIDVNNSAFRDYYITVAETGPNPAVNIFFDLIKPIASDVNQLQDADGLLDRTMITTGIAPGSSAVANANSVDINFSDGVGNKFKFNRDGKITFAAPQYGTSVSSMFVDYGFRFRPTWNGTGTGPELAVSWNDGIELTPITNDHFTGSNKATPFFIQGTYTSVAGKLPGDVYIDGGRNGPANVNGVVNIGRGYTNSINIGKTGTATTIIFNDGSSINGGDITGNQNVDGGGGAVNVWSSPVNTAGMTAKVVVSGKDLATGETQSCEVLLAKKQGSQSISATVYGIVHTSATPLFTVSATVETNGQIKVNATVPGSITTVNVKSVGRVTVL